MRDEVANIQPDVVSDFPEEGRRDIPSLMKGNRGDAAIRMLKLLVRAALPDLDEPKALENGNDLSRFENRQVPHLKQP